MKKFLRKILIFGSLLIVLLFAFMISQGIVRYMQVGTLVPTLPTPESELVPREATINVYTGNVVDPSQQNETPQSFEKQKGPTYPITDGKTFRILAGRKYVCEDQFWADSRNVEVLQLKINEKWKEVYRTKDEGDGKCFVALSFHEKSIKISPLEDYVEFILAGYEWGESKFVNIKTGKDIFPKDTHSAGLVWSKNARNYAFISNLEELGGTGVDRVWVSRFNVPDKLVTVLDLEEWANYEDRYNLKYSFQNLKFLDNQKIEFSVFRDYDEDNTKPMGELARYSYDLKQGELTELFRK